ncbi:MAG TPA: SpoIID/LytB domain-containing protein [Thermoanaerobaculia bacterium]|nr:SpoIID/LytB domain-containing protein [Thermoanaerobaculia bacterium]
MAGALLVAALFAWACGGGHPQPRTAPRAAPTPLPAATPAPTPLPALPEPAQPLPQPPPPEPAPPATADLLLRVGLLSDQTSVTFPCCAAALRAVWEGQTWALTRALRVDPAPEGTEPGIFRVQVAALRDPGQAEALAANLRRATGDPADSVLEAESGLYRVRVGRYASKDEAETARKGLTRFGVGDAWVISEGGGVRDPALRLQQGDMAVNVPGRWVAVEDSSGAGVFAGGHRYRGRMLVYLNDRGTLNLIDELPLEEYLRGVVPSELGPAAYPEIEALKAQAVAARTYAARNLGEFRAEGFDICATPRCQVYGGMEAEHPRSDEAIAATRGEVLLWHDQPIDALFSSTCGGHTEDVGVVFPLKADETYLRGVPCLEAGVTALGGIAPGTTLPSAITTALLPPPATAGAAGYGERLLALARLAGLTPAQRTLESLDARDVRRFVAATFDLALDARLFVAAEDLPYLVQSPPRDWSEEDRRLAALFVKSGLGGPAPAEMGEAQREELLYRLALYLRVLREEEAGYFGLSEGTLHVHAGDKTRDVVLPPRIATYRQLGDTITGGDLSLVPGDHLRLLWQGDALLAVVQEVHEQGVAYDRTSHWTSWQRFKTDRELAALVKQRYPGFPYASFEIVSRGVSGRVGVLKLVGSDGRSELVEGLAVRWTLDLPDTLFTAKRLVPAHGEPGWLFSGRGWGHGVGLCQVGAYGMAVRGHGYRDILAHYYSGTRLGALPPTAAAASVAMRERAAFVTAAGAR